MNKSNLYPRRRWQLALWILAAALPTAGHAQSAVVPPPAAAPSEPAAQAITQSSMTDALPEPDQPATPARAERVTRRRTARAQIPAGATAANAAAPAITPPPQAAFVSLSNIRIVRTRAFDRNAAPQPQTRSVAGPDPSQELTHPGTTFEFKIRPAQGWGIVSINDAKLKNVTSQSGKTLAVQPVPSGVSNAASGGSDLAGWVLPKDLNPEETVIQIRTELPPRVDEQLQTLVAEFALTVGYRQAAHVMDLSKRIGQPIDLGQRDVTLTITNIDQDQVELTALGQVDKIGRITITNLNSEKLEPYSTEVKTIDQGGVNGAKRTWVMAFNQLPPIAGMDVDVYPTQKKITPRYEWNNVPLP